MDFDASHAVKLISPRVTCLITTLNENGVVNAAPYSWVFPLSYTPPMVGFGSSKGKHSFDNAVRSGEFVLNLISEDFAKEAVALEKKHELNEDRVKEVGLSLIDSNNIKTQGISEAEVRIECKFKKIVEIPGSDHKLILGEVLSGFCSKVTPEGHADYTALKLLMHVGGSEFRKIGEKVEIERNK